MVALSATKTSTASPRTSFLAYPMPSPFPPQAGPVPPSARSWTVTVVNGSAQPATLFLAQEDSDGMTQLVGAVTPNVVPPGVTVEVTFVLPAEGANAWAIFINPHPGGGPLLLSRQVPLAGEIRIGANGSPGWLSP
jgi:hypothetical protein